MQEGRREDCSGERASTAAGGGGAPRDAGEAVAGLKWVIRVGDTEMVRSQWTQALRGHDLGISEAPARPRQLRRRRAGAEAGVGVTVDTLTVHRESGPRPWTERGPLLGQVERPSSGGGILKF